MEPMPLALYRGIVEDFRKHGGYSRACEIALRKKYKELRLTKCAFATKRGQAAILANHPHPPRGEKCQQMPEKRKKEAYKLFLMGTDFSGLMYADALSTIGRLCIVPSSTIGSVISLLVQRSMKHNYRKSSAHSASFLDLFQELLKNNNNDALILKIAEQQGINPALFARSVLQRTYGNAPAMKQCLKDTTHIQDKDLAYHIYLAIINDNHYGYYSDVVKQAIGLEYELRLQRELRLLDISFSDENVLRSRGYDKTPDFKLDVPIAVDGFIINWVESKALFGDEENHSGYLKEQLMCYWNRFGPGLVIYWFGYLETLDKTPEVNNMFILRTHFPPKEYITHFKLDV